MGQNKAISVVENEKYEFNATVFSCTLPKLTPFDEGLCMSRVASQSLIQNSFGDNKLDLK